MTPLPPPSQLIPFSGKAKNSHPTESTGVTVQEGLPGLQSHAPRRQCLGFRQSPGEVPATDPQPSPPGWMPQWSSRPSLLRAGARATRVLPGSGVPHWAAVS